jgi:hypothetical protein
VYSSSEGIMVSGKRHCGYSSFAEGGSSPLTRLTTYFCIVVTISDGMDECLFSE